MAKLTFRHPEYRAPSSVVLKGDQLFYVWAPTSADASNGLYYMDTQYLSRLDWLVGGRAPVLLSATVSDGTHAHVDLANAELTVAGVDVADRSIHLQVSTTVADRLYQRVSVVSYLGHPIRLALSLHLQAEFRDVFEVRGIERPERGVRTPPIVGPTGASFHYTGRDDVGMHTLVRWHVPARSTAELGNGRVEATFDLDLQPHEAIEILLDIQAVLGPLPPEAAQPDLATGFATAARSQVASHAAWAAASTRVESDNPAYDTMLHQSMIDLRTLSTAYPGEGRIIDAGLPWYVAPFGRDSLITGIESALLRVDTLVDALRFLAHHQGTVDDPWRDEEPGKMIHELRRGEMARCKEIPHTPYYGSVDATLWWVIGLAEAFRFTTDRDLLRELESPLRAALTWIVRYAHPGGGRLISYRTRSSAGLVNQGWKDSSDSVVDEQGAPAPAPIALVEVQGYAYRALRDGAFLLRALGDAAAARQFDERARQLRTAFLAAFWDSRRQRVAYAIDGEGRTHWTRTSNAGHLLFTSILPHASAHVVARSLFDPSMSSGYGVRTVSDDAASYNPMSYYNGSTWPHDNALAGWGLKVLGEGELLVGVAQGLYDAAQHFPYGRLPELYSGFTRREDTGPVPYPSACNLQGWAVASPLFLLSLMLGLSANGRQVRINKPTLPPWVNYLSLHGLHIAGGSVDVEFARHAGVTYANVLRVEGDVRPMIVPV